METFNSDGHSHVEPDADSVAPAPMRIRWSRTTLALTGLLAFSVAVVSGAVSLFGGASAALPLFAMLLFVGAVVGLRLLAVRDAGQRAIVAAAASTTWSASPVSMPAKSDVLRDTALFDGASSAPPAPAQKPLTAEELRFAAMRVAAKGAADAKLAHTQTLAEGEFDGEIWEPVEVPKPGYVTAARAATRGAEPLPVPASPKSAGTSIKADLAGVGVPAEVELVVSGEAPVGPFTASDKPVHALNNLDDVLQRRRA